MKATRNGWTIDGTPEEILPDAITYMRMTSASVPLIAVYSNKQEIKIAFKNDYIATIMYTLDANYNYKKIAKEKEAKLYADYDHFMTDHGLNIEKLSTTFTSSDLKVKIKLYAEKENLNSMTVKLFLLDSANGEYSSKVLQKYYEEKGFTCNYKN